MKINKQIVIIGGGAAGFFAAINTAINLPDAKIIILEKTNNFLSKVKISGGGRCNVTHHQFETNELVKNYPRGEKELRQAFSQFSVTDTIDWFWQRGIKLKTENDGRMFPESDSSETIINCFLSEIKKYNIELKLGEEVLSIKKREDDKLLVLTSKNRVIADSVICSIGGNSNLKNYEFLKQCGHTIDELVPSLFTLNIPQSNIVKLMGLSVKNGTIKIIGTKHESTGAILITHWGLSGPAVLKLSAFAAYDFFRANYNSFISLNWTGSLNTEETIKKLNLNLVTKSLIVNKPLFEIPKRLWEYLLTKCEINLNKSWNEISKKEIHKFAEILLNDIYKVKGKTNFKEEFVTAGGVNLKEINFKTMESKTFPKLFFCGEVINVDGVTGGFNFQNAWSTAWIAAKNQ